jgi:hypothetical protein
MLDSKDFDFIVLREDWNLYKLEDSTILKIKLVLLRVVQEGLDKFGNPKGGTMVNMIVSPVPPSELRNLKQIDPIIDMKYETIREDWNEYEVSDEFTLKLKPIISQIDRTEKFDPRGEPLYGVSVQATIKRISKKV